MSDDFLFCFSFGGITVLILAGSFLMFLQSRGMSYQRRSARGSMVFRPPLGLRLWLIMVVLWLIAGIILQVISNIDVVGSLFVLLPVACVAGGFIVLLASRRSELCLDLDRNAYRFIEKTLFRSRVYSGSWPDFVGVFVRITRTRSGDMCHVGLAWRNDRDIMPYLGVYGNRIKAQTFAMGVAEKLGLPIVPAPAPGKSPVLLG